MEKLHPHYKPYIVGFVISLLALVGAYIIVTRPDVSLDSSAIGFLIVFALVQLVAQIVFFLHLPQESKPRWNLFAFGLMIVVVGFIVIGSLWIMNNLNYNMMSDASVEKIIEDEGISH